MSWTARRRYPGYLLGLVLAASAVMAVLVLRVAMTELPADAAPQHAASAPAQTSADGGADWAAMSPAHQQVLGPLKAIWPTMSAAQHRRWQLIADRIGHRSPQARQRLHDRMQAWARMTPAERAQARLAFVQARARRGMAHGTRHWRGRGASAGQVAKGLENQRSLPPAVVHVAPGATTVLLTKTFHLPAADAGGPASTAPDGPPAPPAPPPHASKDPMPS